jgi:hypothetical protein
MEGRLFWIAEEWIVNSAVKEETRRKSGEKNVHK